MDGLAWLTEAEACDWLRIGTDTVEIVRTIAASLPAFVEVTTGYPEALTASDECDPTVKQLCRFLLASWFNPDGTDAAQLEKAVASLTRATKALVIAEGLDGGSEPGPALDLMTEADVDAIVGL